MVHHHKDAPARLSGCSCVGVIFMVSAPSLCPPSPGEVHGLEEDMCLLCTEQDHPSPVPPSTQQPISNPLTAPGDSHQGCAAGKASNAVSIESGFGFKEIFKSIFF